MAPVDQTADAPWDYGAPNRWGGDLGHPTFFRFSVLRINPEARPAVEGQKLIVNKETSEAHWLTNVEEVTWADVNAIMTGTITLRELVVGIDSGTVGVDTGDRILCWATSLTGAWEFLWQMRVYKPQFTGSTLTRSFDLVNDLDLLRQSEGNFLYANDKDHKGGWTGREVIIDICRLFQVPFSASEIYPDTPYKLRKILVRRGSPLEVIRNVVLKEHRWHRKKLVTRFDKGRLSVMPLERSSRFRALGPTLMEAAYSSELPPQFGTSITIHGRREFLDENLDTAGRQKGKPVRMHVELPGGTRPISDAINRYGYVHKIVWSGTAKTDEDLEAQGLAWLESVQKPIRHLTLTLPGIVGVKRGDALQVGFGTGLNTRMTVFVKEANYQVSTAGFVMQIGVMFDDPYIDSNEDIIFRLKATRGETIDPRNPSFLPGDNKSDQSTGLDPPSTAGTTLFPGGGF